MHSTRARVYDGIYCDTAMHVYIWVSAESVQSFIFYLYGKLNATHTRIYADDNNKGYRGYKLYLLCLCDCAPCYGSLGGQNTTKN